MSKSVLPMFSSKRNMNIYIYIYIYTHTHTHTHTHAHTDTPHFVYLSMNIWVVSIFWLLCIMLQCAWECKYLWVPAFSSFRGVCVCIVLYHMKITHLIFWGPAILFSTVSTPFGNPTSSAQGFDFLHILPNTCYFLYFVFFYNNHPNGCEKLSHCGFNLHSSND